MGLNPPAHTHTHTYTSGKEGVDADTAPLTVTPNALS